MKLTFQSSSTITTQVEISEELRPHADAVAQACRDAIAWHCFHADAEQCDREFANTVKLVA